MVDDPMEERLSPSSEFHRSHEYTTCKISRLFGADGLLHPNPSCALLLDSGSTAVEELRIAAFSWGNRGAIKPCLVAPVTESLLMLRFSVGESWNAWGRLRKKTIWHYRWKHTRNGHGRIEHYLNKYNGHIELVRSE